MTGPAGRLVAPLALGGLCLVLGLAASLHVGGFDDAFITYTFARNLAGGHGLVWHPGGTPVYGSTTLLYTLLLGTLGALGADIPTASCVLGALGWALCSVLVFICVRDLAGRTAGLLAGALCACSLLPLNLSLGMETGVFSAEVLAVFFLYGRGRLRACAIASALLVLTRPDGALVPLMIAVHLLATAPERAGAALVGLRERAWPGLAIVAAALLACFAYFGSVLPHPFFAKRVLADRAGDRFSVFSVAEVLGEAGGPGWLVPVALVFAGVGSARAVRRYRSWSSLALLWPSAYWLVFTLSGLPSSPWYWAAALPLFYGSVAVGAATFLRAAGSGTRYTAWTIPTAAAAGLLVATSLTAAVIQIRADPFGVEWNAGDQRRQIAQHVLDDMARRRAATATVLAFEVGRLGYRIPGHVVDLLGLVSPDVLAHADPLYALRAYDPDYAVIVDSQTFPPTAALFGSRALLTGYQAIASVPAANGNRYLAYRRAPAPLRLQERWRLDLTRTPRLSRDVRLDVRAPSLLADTGAHDPIIVFEPLQTPRFERALVCVRASASTDVLLELFVDQGEGYDYQNGLKFLVAAGGPRDLCRRLADGSPLRGLRVDPSDRPASVSIDWIKVEEPIGPGGD